MAIGTEHSPSEHSPEVLSSRPQSYFLSHRFPPDEIHGILRAELLYNTSNRFEVTGEDENKLSLGILQDPDQEAFAAFFLGILQRFPNGEESPYEVLPVKTTTLPDSHQVDIVTILVKSSPEQSPRALGMEIERDTRRFRRKPPRATSVTYHF